MRKAGVLRALLAACLLGGVVATDASAAIGDLKQKPAPAGCVSDSGGPCVDGAALANAASVTVSPDGRNAYVASIASNAVAVFDRGADGTLTQKQGTAGCISETGAGPCIDGTALANPVSVTVSPDGKSAYVASAGSNAIAVFDRGADGTLTQKLGTAACIADAGLGPCIDAAALANPISLTVSPDGKSAYVASNVSNAVAVFDRAADGTLTQKLGAAGCISETGAAPCADGKAVDGAFSVVVSPDGKSAYVASAGSQALAVFDRAADGTLTQKQGAAGCVSETGAGPCADGTALVNASSVTVSPDGRNAYVAAAASNAVAAFNRAADGTLTQKLGAAGCISDTGAGPCTHGTALASASSVTVSPDGKNAYVAAVGSNAVAVFDRESAATTPPPGPAPGPAPAASVPLPLRCSGRSIVLLDVHRTKQRVEVSGLTHTLLRGQRASIRALIKGSRPVSATIQADGSFRTTLPLPSRKHRATVRYQATIAGRRSATLKLARQLTIISVRTTSAGARVTAQLSPPTRRKKIAISQQLTCTKYRRLKTLRTNRLGRFTVTLPAPLTPDLFASYRATTQRSRGRTYSLPLVVGAAPRP